MSQKFRLIILLTLCIVAGVGGASIIFVFAHPMVELIGVALVAMAWFYLGWFTGRVGELARWIVEEEQAPGVVPYEFAEYVTSVLTGSAVEDPNPKKEDGHSFHSRGAQE